MAFRTMCNDLDAIVLSVCNIPIAHLVSKISTVSSSSMTLKSVTFTSILVTKLDVLEIFSSNTRANRTDTALCNDERTERNDSTSRRVAYY